MTEKTSQEEYPEV